MVRAFVRRCPLRPVAQSSSKALKVASQQTSFVPTNRDGPGQPSGRFEWIFTESRRSGIRRRQHLDIVHFLEMRIPDLPTGAAVLPR